MKKQYLQLVTMGVTVVLAMGMMVGCSKEDISVKSEESSSVVKTTNDADSSEKAKSIEERADELIKTSNIRVVIGSTSTGGDTYQVSSMVSQKLADVMGKNVKVDAVGATNGFDAVRRIDDGSTIMIFHDQAYLGYLYGKEGYSDIFADYQVGPTLAINPGNAFSVAKNSVYESVEDVIEAVGNGTTVRVAIQPGGVSEIGYSAMKNVVKTLYPGMEENLVAVNTGSQSDKNQLLFDGQADVINSSVQGNEQFNQLPDDDQKAMKFIWLTARKSTILQANEVGFGDTSREELVSYTEPIFSVEQDGVNSFVFDKEFFVLFNKDMPTELVTLYNDALAEVFADASLQQQMVESFFIPNYKSVEDANAYLSDKVNQYDSIIKSLQ